MNIMTGVDPDRGGGGGGGQRGHMPPDVGTAQTIDPIVLIILTIEISAFSLILYNPYFSPATNCLPHKNPCSPPSQTCKAIVVTTKKIACFRHLFLLSY